MRGRGDGVEVRHRGIAVLSLAEGERVEVLRLSVVEIYGGLRTLGEEKQSP